MSFHATLIIGAITCSLLAYNRPGLAEPPSHTPVQRSFVRNWTVKDLRRELHRLGEGRSYARGKELFRSASCEQCHRLNQVGGTLGPDLTGAAKRNSRVVLLREIIEPSKQIADQYQSHTIVMAAGKVYQGLVVNQDANSLYLANDARKPDQLLVLPLDEIEEQVPSALSIMPQDLLNTLTEEEVLDLLAYIEAGGQEDHAAFDVVEE